MTSAERAEREAEWSDPEGQIELARKEDPSFDTVAQHFPEMKFPREILGVREHPKGIGVASNGDLQLNLEDTSATAPVAPSAIATSSTGIESGRICEA